MNTITLLLTNSQIERLYAAWSEFEVKAPAYAHYQLKPENCTITAYQSNKVVFQGKDATIYAAPFQTEDRLENTKANLSQGKPDFQPAITSVPSACVPAPSSCRIWRGCRN